MRARVVAVLAVATLAGPAAAQSPIRCSAFLHERGGSWRAFEPGVIFGPRGPIPVRTGEASRAAGHRRPTPSHGCSTGCARPTERPHTRTAPNAVLIRSASARTAARSAGVMRSTLR